VVCAIVARCTFNCVNIVESRLHRVVKAKLWETKLVKKKQTSSFHCFCKSRCECNVNYRNTYQKLFLLSLGEDVKFAIVHELRSDVVLFNQMKLRENKYFFFQFCIFNTEIDVNQFALPFLAHLT
jgi:hypothetical protein